MKVSSVVLSASLKQLYQETAQHLKGSARRQFMAKVVREMGVGGQIRAEQELGWNRGTIRKGMQELRSGLSIVDAFALRGRKPVEAHLPHLRSDIQAIVEPHSQADPTLKSPRLYTRISAAEVRRQLIAQKGYSDETLPSQEVIRQRLNQMGYRLRRVAKTEPQKVIEQTPEIFAAVNRLNQAADEDATTLRLSIRPLAD